MRAFSTPLAPLAATFASLLLALPAIAATVVSVGDGDTLRVMEGSRRVTVRLACIDAPETAQKPWGAEARRQLQQLALVGSTVSLRLQATDRYGRTVAEIFRGGQSVNLALVRSGAAFAYRQYLARCDRGAYLGAEAAAQQQRAGVWSVPGGIQRPWDWRHGSRASTGTTSSAGSSSNGRRYTCKEIGSFSRAQELLKEGHTYLDRNGDGVACESLR